VPFPRLYAIADIDLLQARALDLASFASELHSAGVKLLQYRNKSGNARAMLRDAALLRELFPPATDVRLIMNDRADLALLSGCDGVHVGQEDLGPEDAGSIVGPNAWVGVSTHSPQQIVEADKTTCDYIAYGPVFATATKNNPDPTVGLAGLRMARTLTRKPLVAIGGITRENFRSVLDAGADSTAVVSGLLSTNADEKYGSTRRLAEDFLTEFR
jgi:thiamine-phosphate pyrophosphorylase